MYVRGNNKGTDSTKNNDSIMSGVVLAWTKIVEAQRAQTAVLNTLTESRQFDKKNYPKSNRR